VNGIGPIAPAASAALSLNALAGGAPTDQAANASGGPPTGTAQAADDGRPATPLSAVANDAAEVHRTGVSTSGPTAGMASGVDPSASSQLQRLQASASLGQVSALPADLTEALAAGRGPGASADATASPDDAASLQARMASQASRLPVDRGPVRADPAAATTVPANADATLAQAAPAALGTAASLLWQAQVTPAYVAAMQLPAGPDRTAGRDAPQDSTRRHRRDERRSPMWWLFTQDDEDDESDAPDPAEPVSLLTESHRRHAGDATRDRGRPILDATAPPWAAPLARALQQALSRGGTGAAAVRAVLAEWQRGRRVVIVCPLVGSIAPGDPVDGRAFIVQRSVSGDVDAVDVLHQAPLARAGQGAAWQHAPRVDGMPQTLPPDPRGTTGDDLADQLATLQGASFPARLRWARMPAAHDWWHVRTVKHHGAQGGRQLDTVAPVAAPAGMTDARADHADGVSTEIQLGPVRRLVPRWRDVGVRVDAARRFWEALGPQWSVHLFVTAELLLAGEMRT